MKKIVLIGDSIRMGYDKYVKEALMGSAEVYYPAENCRFAQNVLRFAHDWRKKGEWPKDIDLVHWNAGLWDILEMDGYGPLSSIEHYTNMIERIDKRLRFLFPEAKMVFATSTAVRENEYKGSSRRRNSVIDEYNRAAIKVLSKTDTVIDDLYSITTDIPAECCSDMTHFNTPEGAAYVEGKVVSVLCRELGIAATDVNIENFELEKYSKANIGY